MVSISGENWKSGAVPLLSDAAEADWAASSYGAVVLMELVTYTYVTVVFMLQSFASLNSIPFRPFLKSLTEDDVGRLRGRKG